MLSTDHCCPDEHCDGMRETEAFLTTLLRPSGRETRASPIDSKRDGEVTFRRSMKENVCDHLAERSSPFDVEAEATVTRGNPSAEEEDERNDGGLKASSGDLLSTVGMAMRAENSNSSWIWTRRAAEMDDGDDRRRTESSVLA